MSDLLLPLRALRWTDLADVLIVGFLLYTFLFILKETRSASVMRGVLGTLVASLGSYAVARWLGLTATIMMFERFWIVIILAVLIIFQAELRKALLDISQLAAFRKFLSGEGKTIDDVLKSVRVFSRQKIGALICIERRDSLRSYASSGTQIDAFISEELLRTIFMTYSPLHDGAVILRADRIVAAGCILPLSANQTLGRDLGTRHRAGLGLTEEKDAVVIVVSEETGIISLAVGGNLERHHTLESLREALQELMDIEDEDKD